MARECLRTYTSSSSQFTHSTFNIRAFDGQKGICNGLGGNVFEPNPCADTSEKPAAVGRRFHSELSQELQIAAQTEASDLMHLCKRGWGKMGTKGGPVSAVLAVPTIEPVVQAGAEANPRMDAAILRMRLAKSLKPLRLAIAGNS